jgi:hypothetical protein
MQVPVGVGANSIDKFRISALGTRRLERKRLAERGANIVGHGHLSAALAQRSEEGDGIVDDAMGELPKLFPVGGIQSLLGLV